MTGDREIVFQEAPRSASAMALVQGLGTIIAIIVAAIGVTLQIRVTRESVERQIEESRNLVERQIESSSRLVQDELAESRRVNKELILIDLLSKYLSARSLYIVTVLENRNDNEEKFNEIINARAPFELFGDKELISLINSDEHSLREWFQARDKVKQLKKQPVPPSPAKVVNYLTTKLSITSK